MPFALPAACALLFLVPVSFLKEKELPVLSLCRSPICPALQSASLLCPFSEGRLGCEKECVTSLCTRGREPWFEHVLLLCAVAVWRQTHCLVFFFPHPWVAGEATLENVFLFGEEVKA